MSPLVRALFRNGCGLATTEQVLNAGLASHELRKLLRSGEWVQVRRGVYAERETWAALDDYRGRPLLRALAAHHTMVEDHVMSHDSAALVLDLPILTTDGDPVHITRPRVRGSRSEYGVKHHRAVFHPDQVVVVDGVPVLNAARTAVDIAREHGVTRGLVACDSALRAGVTRSALWLAAEPMTYWPGITSVRTAIDLADSGAESVGETLARDLVLELGVGRPETQFEITDGHRRARADLRVGRHLFEFDGRVKYQRRDHGGLADADPCDVVWNEKQRQDWLCGLQFGMSRIVWADFWEPRRSRTLDRLAKEYAATVARFGTTLDDLPPYLRFRRAS